MDSVKRQLIGINLRSAEERKQAREQNLFSEKCESYIRASVELIDSYLGQQDKPE